MTSSVRIEKPTRANLERPRGFDYAKPCLCIVTPKKPPAQCMSMTEKGKQCENKPAEGKRYCSRHL